MFGFNCVFKIQIYIKIQGELLIMWEKVICTRETVFTYWQRFVSGSGGQRFEETTVPSKILTAKKDRGSLCHPSGRGI